jgi:DNA repair exonuclease SbcCD ATPase subunit
MITFKEIRWGNAFSYGPSNVIKLDSGPLTQIVGKNGHGKSSIALIIEEVLFNQNSKKIKKADILNRYTKDKNYFIELNFNKDGIDYEVITTRTATSSTIKLLRDKVDISSHTATGTYKTIENVLGFDHKTFSQIVYQSSVSSLEFLTATDTARKKFLIELLNLTVYTRAADVFKEQASGVNKSVDSLQAKVSTVRAWLTKYTNEDLSIKELEEDVAAPVELTAEVTLKTNELDNIETTNKRINNNNKYKELLDGVVVGTIPSTQVIDVTDLKVQLATLQKQLKDGKALAAKCDGPTSTCTTCTQTIDNSTMYAMVKQFEFSKLVLEGNIADINAKILANDKLAKDWKAYNDKILEVEKYHALYDPTTASEVLNGEVLSAEITALEKRISKINAEITRIKASNKKATDHNSKVEVISAQMADMRDELAVHSEELIAKTKELSNLQVLVKAFSTTGLVAYKIECLVKDLEELTNQYLNELSDGRFQLSFKVSSSDKLNVIITDNSHDVDIIALSSGERARVNVATLLAIRKLMQTLSNSRTNLLILDETVENLDAEGKEKLIEVLLAEENLNTFLISHGFSHPLLEKLQVVKEKNVSRIEA